MKAFSMSNLRDAADIIAKFAEAMKTQIEQVDCVLVESGDELAFYGSTPQDDCAFATLSLPVRLESEESLLHREWSAALMDMLPLKTIGGSR